MLIFGYIIFATVVVSLISLIGIFFIGIKVNMIPELHKKWRGGKIAAQLASIFIGILLMWWLKILFEH